jgi:TolB protein
MNADGTDQRKLTQSPYEEREPAWSPDGTQIAYSVDRYGTMDVYVMNADGSNGRRLTSKGENSCPSWSPDGSQIVFSKYDPSGIYVINADGTDERRLAYAGPDVHIFDPEWSPDGQRIVCVVNRNPAQGVQASTTIYVLDIAGIQRGEGMGTASFQPLPRVGDEVNDRPTWSPDGTQIAFSAVVDGQRVVCVVNADGSNLHQLTPADGPDEFSPAWSPDGGRMALQSDAEGGWDIYVTDADGMGRHRLTTAGDNDTDPDWCP